MDNVVLTVVNDKHEQCSRCGRPFLMPLPSHVMADSYVVFSSSKVPDHITQ
jgi:hypothetical protein